MWQGFLRARGFESTAASPQRGRQLREPGHMKLQGAGVFGALKQGLESVVKQGLESAKEVVQVRTTSQACTQSGICKRASGSVTQCLALLELCSTTCGAGPVIMQEPGQLQGQRELLLFCWPPQLGFMPAGDTGSWHARSVAQSTASGLLPVASAACAPCMCLCTLHVLVCAAPGACGDLWAWGPVGAVRRDLQEAWSSLQGKRGTRDARRAARGGRRAGEGV